jgi:hypothetical protein
LLRVSTQIVVDCYGIHTQAGTLGVSEPRPVDQNKRFFKWPTLRRCGVNALGLDPNASCEECLSNDIIEKDPKIVEMCQAPYYEPTLTASIQQINPFTILSGNSQGCKQACELGYQQTVKACERQELSDMCKDAAGSDRDSCLKNCVFDC